MAKVSATSEALMKGSPYKEYHHCCRLKKTSEKMIRDRDTETRNSQENVK